MVYLKIRSTHPLVHPPCQTHPNWIRLVTDPINPPIQISICPHYIPVNPYFPFRVSHEFPLSLNFSGILCKNHQDPIKSAHNQFPINFPSISHQFPLAPDISRMIFSSSLQLLEWLQQEDLRQRSAQMRRSAADLRRRSMERFAAALAQVAT